jgi:hypothetical protein
MRVWGSVCVTVYVYGFVREFMCVRDKVCMCACVFERVYACG